MGFDKLLIVCLDGRQGLDCQIDPAVLSSDQVCYFLEGLSLLSGGGSGDVGLGPSANVDHKGEIIGDGARDIMEAGGAGEGEGRGEGSNGGVGRHGEIKR